MKVLKKLKTAALGALVITTVTTSFQANASVGVLLNPISTAAVVTGLILTGGGAALERTLTNSTGYGGVGIFASTIGIILLDGESGQEVQFQNIPEENLFNMGLTEEEATAYNDNVEELSIAFSVVSAELSENREVSAVELWKDQEEILGTDTINGARKVLAHALNK